MDSQSSEGSGSLANDVASERITCSYCGRDYQGLLRCPNCHLTKEEAKLKAQKALDEEALRGGAGSGL